MRRTGRATTQGRRRSGSGRTGRSCWWICCRECRGGGSLCRWGSRKGKPLNIANSYYGHTVVPWYHRVVVPPLLSTVVYVPSSTNGMLTTPTSFPLHLSECSYSCTSVFRVVLRKSYWFTYTIIPWYQGTMVRPTSERTYVRTCVPVVPLGVHMYYVPVHVYVLE
jgi:hypothetical protein